MIRATWIHWKSWKWNQSIWLCAISIHSQRSLLLKKPTSSYPHVLDCKRRKGVWRVYWNDWYWRYIRKYFLVLLFEHCHLGPTMVRASAKNCGSVAVLTSPSQYSPVLEELKVCDKIPSFCTDKLVYQASDAQLTLKRRKLLAAAAFLHTAE